MCPPHRQQSHLRPGNGGLGGRSGSSPLSLLGKVSPRRLIHAWKRRSWSEHGFRTLEHLLATEACQVQREDAYYGHLVLRLLAGVVLLYTARVIFKGRMTTEEFLYSLRPY